MINEDQLEQLAIRSNAEGELNDDAGLIDFANPVNNDFVVVDRFTNTHTLVRRLLSNDYAEKVIDTVRENFEKLNLRTVA